MAKIYKANQEAIDKGWDWDTIFANDAIETVEEFDSYEEAVEEFDKRGYDNDIYGVY